MSFSYCGQLASFLLSSALFKQEYKQIFLGFNPTPLWAGLVSQVTILLVSLQNEEVGSVHVLSKQLLDD